MKIQCNVCEAAEAVVLCCADEAALCWSCDDKVHAANKLASKHQRVLISNSKLPTCDICQEAAGYFFCLEDRALLCRKCDVSIHTINSLVSSHQRFLLTGVKVGLEPVDPNASNCRGKITEAERSLSVPSKTVQMPATSQFNKVTPVQVAGAANFVPSRMPYSGGSSADSVQQWPFDDFLALTDYNQDYNYLANGSSKADSEKLVESDWSPILGAMEVSADCLGQVPDASWAVPDISSPPTASGLSWSQQRPRHQHQLGSDTFVPDVCYLPTSNFYGSHQNADTYKRRRNF
ncbi:hypothetical protein M8C21_017568 [Ambrosia artemisiifolia]|uniref:B box-type domain-containing protein n=1 Tax=Ambrosia artemisiifolia TaxID=4212 RepID=A0AAD5BR81_AMBAR|nr:hypothetical protein M8C21_017568 [Ambrosia artemisiifolia]